MNLKEIEKRSLKIEKDLIDLNDKKEKLQIEVAVLEAQASFKSNNILDFEEKISFLKAEKRKLEIAKEILQTPALLENDYVQEEQSYESFKANFEYRVGNIFKVEKRLYQVLQNHKSDEKFNKLLTNKYQLIDNDTLKPIFNYSITKIYKKNDKVLYDDVIYVSKIDNNNLSPKSNQENWLKLDI